MFRKNFDSEGWRYPAHDQPHWPGCDCAECKSLRRAARRETILMVMIIAAFVLLVAALVAHGQTLPATLPTTHSPTN